MSTELAKDAVTTFESEVHHVFQADVDGIKDRVRVKDGRGMKSKQFPVLGRSKTTERTNYHTDVPVGNMKHDPVTITVRNWTVADYTDIFLNNQTNYDDRQELAKSFSMALVRRMLQIVVDALVAANITTTVAKNVSGTNDNLNRKMLKEAMRLLSKNGVDKKDRTFMAHTNGVSYLTDDPRVGSSDYNSSRVIEKGEVGNLWGFNFFEVPDLDDEGGLPLNNTDRTNFAWQKMAVGLLVNMDPSIEIWYDGNKLAHKVTGKLSANAGVIDPRGCVKVITDETYL